MRRIGDWIAMNFELAVNKIEDPVICNSVFGIEACLSTAIVSQSGVADFDDQKCRTGSTRFDVILLASAHHRHIRLRLRSRRKLERILPPHPEPRSEGPLQSAPRQTDAGTMRFELRRHCDDSPLDELNPFVPEEAELREAIVLLDRPPPRPGFGDFRRFHGSGIIAAIGHRRKWCIGRKRAPRQHEKLPQSFTSSHVLSGL